MYSSALLYRAYRCESTRSGVFQFCFLFFEWTTKKPLQCFGLGYLFSPVTWLPFMNAMGWVCLCVCARMCFFVVSHSTSRGQYLSAVVVVVFCCCFLLDKMIWRFSALSVSDNHASTDMSICICNTDSVYVCESGRGRDPMRCDVICLKLQTHVCTRSRTRNVLKSIFK